MARAALALVLVAFAVAPAIFRASLEAPPPGRPCRPAGRGQPPRGWLGCEADPGPSRPLEGEERLLLGLPLDPNTARARDLAYIPGLSARLAGEIVREREAGGPFLSVDDLVRVRGIGPVRLGRARAALEVAPEP